MRYLFILILNQFLPLYCLADEPTFSGVVETDIKKLRVDLPTAFQGELSYEEVDNLIRSLTLTGTYERVFAQELDNGSIQILAKPLRIINRVSVKGNESYSTSFLIDMINVRAGDRFERKKVVEAGEKLKNFYGESGYFNTLIEVSFTKENAANLTVEFKVIEKKPCIIKSAIVESANPDLSERLERITLKAKGRALTTERIDSTRQKLEAFLKEHRFLRSELLGPEAKYNADKTEAFLTYKITEPYQYEFIVSGNKQMTEPEVYRNLSPDTIERGTSDPATDATERIRQSYLRLGYPNVEVQTKTIEIQERFLRRVRMELTENQRIRVTEIAMTGRMSRNGSYYSDFIRSNSTELIRKGYYNRQDIEKGIENLITELRNQGFLRAKVQSSRLEISEKSNEGRVVILIDEGPLTQIRAVEFTGNESFTAQELMNVLNLRADAALRLGELEASIEGLKTFYKSRGYLEMRIVNDGEELIQYNERGTQASIRFDIFEGPKVIIGEITIDGNTFTKSEVIYKTVDLKVGDVLTPDLIDESETKLNRLGIFSRASVKTAEEGTKVSRRNVVIVVSERDPGTFRLGAGATSERDLTVRGFMGLGYNNLFGTGRGISGRAELKSHVVQVNYPQYEVVASYLEPFLLNTQARGRINLTRSERIFNYVSKAGITQVTASNKIDLFVEKDFGKHWRLNWKAWSIDARREFELNNQCIDNNGQVTPGTCGATSQQIATIGPLVEIDYRDNSFVPTKGHFSNFNLDYSDPFLGSSHLIQFVRLEGGHTRYFPINGRTVWANSLRGGYVTNLSNQVGSGVPASHAFFLGGLSTIRGFGGTGANEKIPPEYLLPVGRGNQLLIDKDSYYGLIKSELRFSIVGDHGGVVFYDGGLVQVTGRHFPRPYRDAVGFGYRYLTPVGPLSLDVGFKINPITEEGKKEEFYRFHFSVGTF